MKKAVKISTAILFFMFAFLSIAFSQEEVKIDRARELSFEGESKKAEIKVNSTEEYNYLVIRINCQLSAGDMKVEILDPGGKIKGNFTVKSDETLTIGDKTTSESNVAGQMSKVFAHPVKGDWIVRAVPSSATGRLTLLTTQGFEPRIDLIDLRSLK